MYGPKVRLAMPCDHQTEKGLRVSREKERFFESSQDTVQNSSSQQISKRNEIPFNLAVNILMSRSIGIERRNRTENHTKACGYYSNYI